MAWAWMFIPFFCFSTAASVSPVRAAEVDWGLEHRWPIIASEDQVWVGTVGGLYRYQVSEDSWLVFTPREGLCGWDPGLLGLDQGVLWVGTSQGLCNADINLFDWDVFDTTRGLPGNDVLSLAFEEDYVWVGTDQGAVRFDPLTEELESFTAEGSPPRVRVNDMAVEGETVWLATEEGVWEFSIEYETWRTHTEDQGLICRHAQRIIAGAGSLWFLTDAGLARFDVASRAWFSYHIPGMDRINDVALDGSAIWLATDRGVFFYDPALDQWREFQELHSLPVQKVNGIVLAAEQIWLATEIGVARFDDATQTWTLYTVENGLSSNQARNLRLWKQIVFVASDEAIDYYKLEEDRWYSQRIDSPGAAQESREVSLFSLGGPEGTVFRPSSQVSVRLLGRASYQYDRSDEVILGAGESDYAVETQGRTDLVVASVLGGGRTANAFYNDTRFDRAREYGLRYRGVEPDLFQELSLGDMRWNPGRGELLPTLGLFGAAAGLEVGPRTSRLRRRRLAIALAGGDQTTEFQTDFFIGSSHAHSGSVEDRHFLRRRFFPLGEQTAALSFRSGGERIYMDDGLSANNTPNTLTGWSMAGVVGDFDLLHPVEDYALDESTGLLDLYVPPPDSGVVVAVFEVAGDGEDSREVLLYGKGIDLSLANRYFLGATEILPQSLFLSIVDTLGMTYSLARFGLDNDGDGAVDAQFVDFHNGILRFPEERPFPDQIYLPEDPQHLYAIQFNFQTSSTAFQLTRSDLVSESEQVVVDGVTLRRGEDYIVDYRSGSLLFLREGLIESDSRVEVEYEHRRQSEERLRSLGAYYSPSDAISAGLNAVRYYPQEGDSSVGGVDLIHATGELRLEDGLAGLDVLVQSEAARSTASETQGSAALVRASAKGHGLRLLAELEDYDQDFLTLRPRRTVLGQLIRRTRAEAQYERSNLFILDADWTTEGSLDSDGQRADEERYQARGVLIRKGYPSLVMAVSRFLSSGASPFPDRTSLRGDLEYQLPSIWVSTVGLHALKLTTYLHRSWEDGVDSTRSPASQRAIRQGEYARLDVAPRPAFQVVASVRQDWRKAQLMGAEDDYRSVGKEGEAILTTNCDEIPGLSLYARLEGNSHEKVPSGAQGLRDFSLDRHRQVVARIYPGFWQRALSILTLELDYVRRWNGQLTGLRRKLDVRERYWSIFAGGELVAAEDFHSRRIRGELRPFTALSLNLGLERQDQDIRRLSSVLPSRIWKYTSKIEIRRGSSVLVINYIRDEMEKSYISTGIKDAPSIWWERRWNRGLITKMSFFFWRETMQERKVKESSWSLSPRLGITWRWPKLGVLGAVDLVDDLSLTRSRREVSSLATSTLILANALKLDLWPLPMSLIRLQSQVTYTNNEFSQDVLSHNLSLKLTVQF